MSDKNKQYNRRLKLGIAKSDDDDYIEIYSLDFGQGHPLDFRAGLGIGENGRVYGHLIQKGELPVIDFDSLKGLYDILCMKIQEMDNGSDEQSDLIGFWRRK